MNGRRCPPSSGRRLATRRDALRLGGLAGLSCLTAFGAGPVAARPRADACLMIFLGGGPSHLDTFDPKPDAPAEFRGEFGSIATRAPGVRLGEHLPGLAGCANLFTVVRSLTHEDDGHAGAIHRMLTGEPLPGGQSGSPSCESRPHIGASLAASASPGGEIPAFVTVPSRLDPLGAVRPGEHGGDLGVAHDPVVLSVTREPSLGRTASDRRDDPLGRAADLRNEPARMRERYGRNLFGRSALCGRRLIEAGAKFVQVNWVRHLDGGWDTHADGFASLKDDLLPTFDRAASALLGDMASRGLLDRTLVVIAGEFGRTPRINPEGGRDHWPGAFSAILAGAGLAGGRAYGATDRLGAHVMDRPVTPARLASTIRQALGSTSGVEPPIAELWDDPIA
ncbi:DUF1501 domain-containing protein [Tundrisphaera sp. TA3]|uniref:DUF1501 domain-containing protein n=1 Tax=Tundrisphaera sp. TA3 TaxID=3435775 RepID=UPI003EB7F050